jgi:hypothetical protein
MSSKVSSSFCSSAPSFGSFSVRGSAAAADLFTPVGFDRRLLECPNCVNPGCVNEWCAKGGPGGKPLVGGSRCSYCQEHFKCKCTCLQETCYNRGCINDWCRYRVGGNRCAYCQEHFNCTCPQQASAAVSPVLPVSPVNDWDDWEEEPPGCQCSNPLCRNRPNGTCTPEQPCFFCSRNREKWCKCTPPNCDTCDLPEGVCLCQVCVDCGQVYGVDGTVCNCDKIAQQMSLQETDPYSLVYIEGVLDEKPYTSADFYASRENGETLGS